jgi:AraC-like DNA-binding protein
MEQFSFLSKKTDRRYSRLAWDAICLIEKEYAYLYGIDDLADRLEVSKHHLIRMFTADTGISPGKYLVQVRMHHAKIMLQSGEDTPLEIIAGACGYSCANYFSKAFKKQTGMTPSEYTKASRPDPADVDTGLLLEKLYL